MARILIGNIKGPQGEQGPQGVQGPVGPQGRRALRDRCRRWLIMHWQRKQECLRWMRRWGKRCRSRSQTIKMTLLS